MWSEPCSVCGKIASQNSASLRNIKARRPLCRIILRVLAETSLRKTLPDFALVLPTGQRFVRIQNRISRRDKVRVARLQRHTVEDKLHNQMLAIRRHAILIKLGELSAPLAVLVDQIPHDLIQHGRPDSADSMHPRDFVDVRVHMGIRVHIRRVHIRPNTLRVVEDPITHGIIRSALILRLETNSRRHEVTPTLAHTTGLEQTKAARVCRSASQAVGHTMGVLVDYNAGIEAAVAPRRRGIPHVHSHAPGLAIWRSREVCVVHAGAVLSVENNKVVTNAARTIVVEFEVAGGFFEAKDVEKVVVGVCSVEELGDRGVGITFPVGVLRGVVVFERERAGVRTRVIQIIWRVGVV